MQNNQYVITENLAADHRGVGDKILVDSVLGGSGDPVAAPNTPDKIWHWWDTAVNRITHLWSPALGQWVPLSPWPLTVEKQRIPGDFATGFQEVTTTRIARNCTITRTAVGRYTVNFTLPHPDGINYEVVYGSSEAATTRDTPTATTVRGSRTANGFNVQVTTGDNSGAADVYVDEPFSFACKQWIEVVVNVSF